VDGMALDVTDPVTRVYFVPAAVEIFRNQSELDDQYARQIEGIRFTAFFAPQAQKGFLVLAHDGPGIGAADELAAVAYYCGGAVNLGHSSAIHRIGVVSHCRS
jgi:hypothetical protein